MKKKTITRGIAFILAVLTSCMTTIAHLPSNILTSWAFGLVFVSSGQAGHPYLRGIAEGEKDKTWFLCMNKGASAKNGYDYSKINMDVSYSDGTLEQKRMFWAYIGAFGSAIPDREIDINYKGAVQPNQAKEVSWSMGSSNGGSSFVETMARDGFMALDKIPPGCKTPQDIFSAVSNYGEPGKALWMGNLQKGPGEFDLTKLYNIAGMSDLASFQKYCKVEPADKNDSVRITWGADSFTVARVDAQGVIDTTNKNPITLKITYDPTIFRVIEINGGLEFFKCNVPGSQQLYRAHGTMKVTNPLFYMSTQQLSPEDQPSTGGGGGDQISVTIYEHQETFESNYKVNLTKRDYETGNPLEDSTWEVLEKFDKSQLSADEEDGGIVEEKMREKPNTWKDWLIFNDDMVTDKNGYISHADKRYYDFSQKYCDGHPIPPEPEEEESGEGEDDDGGDDAWEQYEALIEEWQNAVDECSGIAADSGGTFHHWECGLESIPSEKEAFEQSGCKEAAEAAYETFINLEYAYTFRETNAKDGYIINSPTGHPDDVPIEIITTASSESLKKAVWTQASNKSIVVSGHRRDMVTGKNEGEDEDSRSVSREPARSIRLTETYDLTPGQRFVNGIRNFFGLPDKYLKEHDVIITLAAKERDKTGTPSDAEESLADEELIDDISKPTEPEYKPDAPIEPASPANAPEKIQISILDEDKLIGEKAETDGQTAKAAGHFDSSTLTPFSGVGKAVPYSETDGTYIHLDRAMTDSQPPVTPGKSDRLAHSFVVYNHRVPGQIHFNKKDLALEAGEDDTYSAYGDSQGDGTLEGAVYGLFAADDIYAPDTQRDETGSVTGGLGIIFDANDLVAVAATDRNGDGSFMTITEKPHSLYNYKSGKIEYTGKAYPQNLYNLNGIRKTYPEEDRGRIYQNNVTANGGHWVGRPLILGNYYIRELTRSEGYELSITGKDMAVSNADNTTRADYGDSQDAKAYPVGSAWIKNQLTHAVTFPEGNSIYGNRENLFTLGVTSKGATEGFQVVLDGIPEDADFYFDQVTTKPVTVKIPTGGEWVNATEAPFYETAKEESVFKRDKDGNLIPNPAAVKDMPVPYLGIGYEAREIDTSKTLAASDPVKYQAVFLNTDENINYVKAELEHMLRQLDMTTPKDADGNYSRIHAPVYDEPKNESGNPTCGMPEVVLTITGISSNASLMEAIIDYYGSEKVFTYGSLQKLEISGTTATATVAVGMSPGNELLYSRDASGDVTAAYLFKVNENTNRYVLRKYVDNGIASATRLNSTRERYHLMLTPDYTINTAGIPEDVMTFKSDRERYLHYDTGDTLYDYWYHNGTDWVGNAPVKRREYVLTYEEKVVDEEAVNTSKIARVNTMEEVADPAGSTYVWYDTASGQYTLHTGSKDTDLTGVKNANFTIAIPDGVTTITRADIEKIGADNVWGYQEGERLNNSAYIIRIAGAGAGAFTSKDFNRNTSYIKNQRLIYKGNHNINEDGNTQETPNSVLERPITQKVKVTKKINVNTDGEYDHNTGSIHKDWFTENLGGFFDRLTGIRKPAATAIPNFRFRIFLKSNLEGLYRDETGTVVWQDRNGNTVNVAAWKEAFPADVQKLYTKVLHEENPLYRNAKDAVIVNTELYSIAGGFIQEKQNPGYTRILETVNSPDGANVYNYKKFFEAISAANTDKWNHPGNVANTSFKPFPPANTINTSDLARENAKVSDAVRQFALTWYHQEEVKKLVQNNPSGETEAKTDRAYSDALYDRALYEAIRKAQNYLQPFFTDNMEYIYAVEWDSEDGGGKDKDMTTLSADILSAGTTEKDNFYHGISRYLPYGTYVISEQQPEWEEFNDFPNRHYQIDEPKEIELPAVYAGGKAGSDQIPEALNPFYNFNSQDTPDMLAGKYFIRFNEEWSGAAGEDSRNWVIRAHDTYGDYEVYKYGLDLEKLSGTAGNDPTHKAHFKITQSPFDPGKDYYNTMVDDITEGGNPDSHYYPDDAPGTGYIPDAVEMIYHYASVSENKTIRGGKTVMEGMQNAYDGKYAPMLIPWSVRDPEGEAVEVLENPDGTSSYQGYGCRKFTNTFYTTRLRIEKLDTETGESILHEEAIFAIYAASREDQASGNGRVKFYEKPTVISGSRIYLEAMGAAEIYPFAKDILEPDLADQMLWYGTVPAGTPVCLEEEQVVLTDDNGNKTGQFQAFTTKRDGYMSAEDGTDLAIADQNTGYLETPRPLGAGAYVLAEIKPPDGYARSKPIAVEIYSDQVAYYKNGNRDERVAAAIFRQENQDNDNKARIYVGNTPVRLEVTKKKVEEKTVTYRVTGRVEGSITELNGTYGLKNLELAYNASGTYLGYGWKKGTLETLSARKGAGEQVEIIYESGVFSGYANITRPLLSGEDKNRYLPGATLTLHDALEVRKNGDSQDFAYDGVIIERDRNGNIIRMYVKKGYAGTTLKFVRQNAVKANKQEEDEHGLWSCRSLPRPDTDILYYSLGGLRVLERDKSGRLCGYDRDGKSMRIIDGETSSIYALKNNRAEFEIVSSSFHSLAYDSQAKAFTRVSSDTEIYHLDEHGNRDARVVPYTGMAYVTETVTGRNGKPEEKTLVWAVHMIKDRYGSVIARNKIRTSRIAAIHADTPLEYIGGTYRSTDGGRFEKWMNPVVDRNGQVVYYQRSGEKYFKSSPVVDRDGEFVYDRYNDNLHAYNEDAYTIKTPEHVYDKGILWDEEDNRQVPLYMRQGDNFILENTWISGDRSPNDPFDTNATQGQPDMLKRVIPGTYILEELIAPSGYGKAMPVGITVGETQNVYQAEMADEAVKVELSKLDAPSRFSIQANDHDRMFTKSGTLAWTEGKAGYTFRHVPGVTLSLYQARKVYTADLEQYPEGWYYKKISDTPFSWTAYDGNNRTFTCVGTWITGEAAIWLEGIPAGGYILKEISAPAGFVRSEIPVEIQASGAVQVFSLPNDHTKLEIYKYQKTDGEKEILPNVSSAGLSLYRALPDETGSYWYREEDLVETWDTDDCSRYTAMTDLTLYEKWGIWERIKSRFGFGRERYSGFQHDFERMYRQYGTGFEELHWYYTDEPYNGTGELPGLREGVARQAETEQTDRDGYVRQIWTLEDGRQIRICITPEQNRATGQSYLFEYQYHYQKLAGNTVSYDTPTGGHRFDYLPWEGDDGGAHAAYLLVETRTPVGYETAKPKLIQLEETGDVQLYALENRKIPQKPEPPSEETTAPETEPESTPEETREEPTTPPETVPPETTAPATKPEPGEESEATKPSPSSGGEETTPCQTTAETEKMVRIGSITASYPGDVRQVSGWLDQFRWHLSRTGDKSLCWLWITLAVISGAGVIIGIRRKHHENKKKKS